MRRSSAAVAAFFAVLSSSSIAHAGVYADDLSKCVVSATSPSDQTQVVVYIFEAMTAHPAIRTYANVTDAQRAAALKQFGALLQRLLTTDCRKEAVAALKYEGSSSIGAAFNVLGQVAVRSLFTDPAVQGMMGHVDEGMDKAKMSELFKEAGVPDSEGASK